MVPKFSEVHSLLIYYLLRFKNRSGAAYAKSIAFVHAPMIVKHLDFNILRNKIKYRVKPKPF